MEQLRDQIDDLRHDNHYNNNFVPKDALDAVLTPEAVRKVLEERKIEKHKHRDIVQSVIGGHSRIFAILVRIGYVETIFDFIRSDQFQGGSSLDQRLPFNKEYLSRILPEKVAKKFYKEQWEYAAPVLSRSILPRDLDDKTILPILHENHIDKGGFGTVFEITLHNAHHCFGSEANKFIRKDFPANKKENTRAEFELELRNLSILGTLKHPYIIELLSAYTWKGTHSLVFPLLGKNLHKFLSEERREHQEQLQSDASIFIALARLSLALQHVHNFVARFVDLKLIGCHHDLKPDNIFINGESFVLADFGLSTFKDISQDSKTTHKKGETNYLAPECENITVPNFTKGRAGRKSDIWAFGCIIAEVLTYVSLGPGGIRDFQAQRAFTMQDCWTFSSFHCGNGPNPEVDAWLVKLEAGSRKSRRTLVQLIKRMLQINPDHRPDAKDVAIELQVIALQEKTYDIDKLFDTLGHRLGKEEEHTTLFIEHARYQSWKETCGITDDDTQNTSGHFPGLEFNACLDVLSQFQGTLNEILDRLPDTDHAHLFLPMKYMNSRLQQLLPNRMREESETRFVQNTVFVTRDRNLLGNLGNPQEALEPDTYGLSASRLAKMKLMTEVAEECWHKSGDGPRLDVDMAFIHLEKTLEHHHLGRISTPTADRDREVLIEWLCYDSRVLPETEGRQRGQRVEAVARLLNSIAHPPGFRLLRCSNFFHDPTNSRFGLAFDFPSFMYMKEECSEEGKSVITLSELLDRSRRDRTLDKPPLGERFKLAQALTSSICEFHKVGWLHRNISPHNVVFFESSGNSTAYSIGNPYVIGFSHGRPNDPNEFTQGPGQERQDYQHPEYIKKPQRYKIDFDYYSLGIVLLEIAHWKLLSQLTAGPDWKVLAPAEFRLALINKVQSGSLAYTIGTRYCQAIKVCLSGYDELLGQEERFDECDDVNVRLQRNFQGFVVDELAKCSA